MDNLIRMHRGRGVATLTLNRPEARNAFDLSMLTALHKALSEVAADDAIRCVLIQAEGENFSVGGDIRAFHQMQQEGGERSFAELLERAQASVLLIREMPQPVVVAVQGAAAGFGFSLALAADFTVAAEHAIFVAGYAALGLPPDGGLSQTLRDAVGYKKAAEILMLGGVVSARDALALGLAQQVVPDDLLTPSALDLALRLANGSVNAIRRSKLLLASASQHPLALLLEVEKEQFLESVAHPEFAEGIAAFAEKRPPQFHVQGEQA